MKKVLLTSSAVMIIGSNVTNFLNYIYHLLMGRLLGPASYGELATLLSFIGLLGMIPFSLGLVIIKYTSSTKNEGEVSVLTKWFISQSVNISIILLIFISLTSFFIASFLKTNFLLVIFISVMFMFTIPSYTLRSVLQGLLKFNQHIISILVENLTKLFLGILLVFLGLSVYGAIFGILVAAIIGWMMSRYFVHKIVKYNQKTKSVSDPKKIILYVLPVLIQAIAMTSLYSLDLILVRHFFSSHDAGIYAAVATLGKIIFFAAGPIGAVMFPLISKRNVLKKSYQDVILYSFSLTIFVSMLILGFYYLSPKFAINILFGSLYLEGMSILVWYGVFMFLFTLANLLVNLNLSLNKIWIVVFPLVAAVVQGIGIIFHHQTLKAVIEVSTITSLVMLVALLIFTWQFKKPA